MATSFNNRPNVSEIVVPGPASTQKSKPVDNVPGPANAPKTYANQNYDAPATDKAAIFNNPEPPSQNTLGGDDLNERVQQTRQDDNAGEKPYSVGLYDIDEALGYYFNNVLKPTILENNEIIQVPVLYGSPERWSAMTNFGAYRDNKGKLILPLIMYRKTNMAKNENMLFPRIDQLYYLSARKYDAKDRYDNFAVRYVKNPIVKTNKYALTAIPNYVNISYECVVWTPFIEQMNKLIEKIQFSDFSYWGDPKKFRFRIILDAFDTAVELTVDTERMVKSTFTTTIYGYILPEEFSAKSTTQLSLGPKKIVFTEQTDVLDQKSTYTYVDIYRNDALLSGEPNIDMDFLQDTQPDLNLLRP
jgi:hypothetical protein